MTNSVAGRRSGFRMDWGVGALLVVSLVWLGYNAATLIRYPTVLPDESLVGLVAYRMTPQGQLPGVSTYDPFGVYPFRLYLVGLAQWFRLFGVGLVQARAFSLVGGFVAGWLMLGLGRTLYNARVGAVAAIIFWSMPALFWTSHFVRPEMWIAAANLGLFWLGWQVVQYPTRGRMLFLGFLAVAILDIYLSALSTTFSIGMLSLILLGRQRKWGLLVAFGAGAVVGALYYLVAQFAPDWQTNLIHWQYWLTSTGHAGPKLNLIQRILSVPEAFWRYYVRYSVIGWLEVVYFGVAAGWLLIRRTLVDWYVLGAGAVALGLYAFAFASPWHVLDGLPMVVLGVAAATEGLGEKLLGWVRQRTQLPNLRPELLMAVGVAPLLLGHIALLGYYGYASRTYDYFAYVQALRPLIPAEGVIFAEGTWWYGFTDQPFWWDDKLEEAKMQTLTDAQALVDKTLHDHAVKVILLDENLGPEVVPSANVVTRKALANYIAAHCALQGQVEKIAYGVDLGGPGTKQTKVYVCKAGEP